MSISTGFRFTETDGAVDKEKALCSGAGHQMSDAGLPDDILTY